MILGKILIMSNNAFIKEIFESIQGEGPYIGYKQLFVRFSNCNLNCSYCDTDFKSDIKEYTPSSLIEIVNRYFNIHSISLTGGEPLLEVSFLKEFLPLVNKKIYLETNGTLFTNLKEIVNLIDIISMDVKINSSSKNGNLFDLHKKFIKIALDNNKEIFIKLVFDENITEEEIINTINLAKENDILIVLQPKMEGKTLCVSDPVINYVLNSFIKKYQNVRLIPQVHKFINVQ